MIRGYKRKIPSIPVPISASMHNRFDIEVIDSKTGKIKKRAQAENVICTNLWSRLLTPTTYFNYIHYGTGTGTPASTDTSLFAFLGYKTPSSGDDVYASNISTGIFSLTRKVSLAPEDNVGAILTEVGIGYSTSSSNLCTHALLKDMNGNPISIEKTSTDLINIYATVFVHWSTSGYDNGYISLVPALTPFIRALLGMYSSGYMPTAMKLTLGLTACSSLTSITVTPSYSVANKTITLTAARIPASSTYNDLHGLMYALFGSTFFSLETGGSWYSGASIVGEAIGTGDGITKDFATAFSFPENSTVYVDAVEQTTGVSVDNALTTTPNIGLYFHGITSDSTPANLIFAPTTPGLDGSGQGAYGTSKLYYNPYFGIGCGTIMVTKCAVYMSDDLENWVSIGYTSGNNVTYTISETYKNYKFFKITSDSSTGAAVKFVTPATSFTGTTIHFDTPPASGAVITADYTTKAIAKDANHVFDVSVVITLGEYTQ